MRDFKLRRRFNKYVKDNPGGGSGGGGEVFVVNVTNGATPGVFTFDKTFNEIFNARNSGQTIMCVRSPSQSQIIVSAPALEISYVPNRSEYSIVVCMEMTLVKFTTNNPDGYPVFSAT